MTKLSTLIERGAACTGPAYREYATEDKDGNLCCCALGAAAHAMVDPQCITMWEVDGQAYVVHRRWKDHNGRRLMKLAGSRMASAPKKVGLSQAVGNLNDRLMREHGMDHDPRPQIVAWLRELDL